MSGDDSHVNQKTEAYAVLRFDEFGLAHEVDITDLIRVVAVVPTLAEAESEVIRLSDVNEGKQARYFWQYAPYFPNGRGVGSDL